MTGKQRKQKTEKPRNRETKKQRNIETKKQGEKASEKAEKASRAAKASKVKEPETMEELLAVTGYKLHGFKRGDVVLGTVTEKKKKAIFVDIGGKTEGVILDKELEAAADLVGALKEGDKIEVYVHSPESDSGQILLSLRKAVADWRWGQFKEKLEMGEVVEVRGREVNKGGLIVDVYGVQGFVPASQFGRQLQGQLDVLINKTVKVKPIEVDRKTNRLIFSEKAVSEAAEIEKKKELLGVVAVGDVLEAEVTGVMPFGVFVRVVVKKGTAGKGTGGTKGTEDIKDTEGTEEIKREEGYLEGLVHISEISWEKVEDVSKLFKLGEKIKVKVLEKNLQTGKLNLSRKRLLDDPWLKVAQKYLPDKKVKGIVSRVAPFGVFVNFEPGVDGLIHISKIPAEMIFKAGDEVDCFVESVDMENRRMSLGVVLGKKPVGYK